MEKAKRRIYLLCFCLSLCAVTGLGISLGTNSWVVATPQKESANAAPMQNAGQERDCRQFEGTVNFGLFKGNKMLNYGLGCKDREVEINVACYGKYCTYSEEILMSARNQEIEELVKSLDQDGYGVAVQVSSKDSLFDFGLWVSVIAFLGLSILWGLVAAGFSLYNSRTTPIESVLGHRGLYFWNGIAAFLVIITMILYAVIFHMDMSTNVLATKDRDDGWTSEGRAYLSWSYWILIAPIITFLLNILLVRIAGAQLRQVKYKPRNEKGIDGMMMF